MRMLGIGVLVALIAGALGAGSAWAAKDPYSVETWGQYKFCPWQLYNEPEPNNITDCFYGRTAGGKEGGEFKYGHITVKLNKPVVIQGGYRGGGNEIEVVPAANGGESLESPELAVIGGLNVITSKIQQEAGWPQALKESFAAAKKAKETKALVKIETAGTECFTVPGCLNTEHLLEEKGTAFRLSLKVKITNPWLTSLGGGPCYVGSDENPVKQELTSGDAGRAGEVRFSEDFTNLEVHNSRLVDVGWHISKEQAANGCGGPEYESYVNKALNLALEVENSEGGERTAKTGVTWLTGNLHDAAASVVIEKGEKGEL
jgi:hypothetical protein